MQAHTKVALGPVIGKVDTTTARILLEMCGDCQPLVSLESSKAPGKSLQKECKAYTPTVFEFDGLQPATVYNVRITGVSDDSFVKSKFHTLDPAATKLRVVAAACDKGISKRGDESLYTKLYTDLIQNDVVDLVIRHGDQVYADQAFTDCQALVKAGKDVAAPETQAEMEEIYSKHYRKTWMEDDARVVLASASHLMMWDDHEIRNDFGTQAGDDSPASLDFQIARAARRSFWKYQRALWDPNTAALLTQDSSAAGGLDANPAAASPDFSYSTPGAEGSLHMFCGKFVVALIDFRAARSFYRAEHADDAEKAGPGSAYLSPAQWTMLERGLGASTASDDAVAGDTPLLDSAQTLIVVCPAPPIWQGRAATNCLATFAAQRDKLGMSLRQYRGEQTRFLSLLQKWKQGSPSSAAAAAGAGAQQSRDVLLVGGDFHMGANTELRVGGEVALDQLITSGFSNAPPPAPLVWLYKCCLCLCPGTVGDPAAGAADWRLRHTGLTTRRNYGLITCAQATEATAAKIDAHVVTAETDYVPLVSTWW